MQRQSGFTLIEMLVVMAVMALILQVVAVNIGAWIPSSALKATTGKIQSELDFVRSEARLQGKPYRLEFDLDKSLYRMVLPPEEELVSIQTAAESNEIALQWMPVDLNERVVLFGYNAGNRPTVTKGIVEVAFDENGFTADQSLYFKLADDEEAKMVWTMHLWGLNGTTQVLKSEDGVQYQRQLPVESNF
jgi:prepilin-type N-terminal cleavage/methylation domain-containing protein